jgi:hypothetical protein
MNRIRPLLAFALALGATILASCASTQRGPEEWDGLVRRPHPRLAAVWVKPDAEIVAYRNVLLDPVEVRFARNWDPHRGGRNRLGRLDSRDVAAIKNSLADIFRETFRAELERGGYQLVTEPGPDTLRVTPAIIDLFITAPETMPAGRGRTYTANSGRMTLVVELRDSLTGEILARAIDTRAGRDTGTLTISNRVTNTADARRAIGVWATALRQTLDDLYERAG